MHRLIRQQHMWGSGIRIRINRNRCNAEGFGCAHNPAGNLSAIGNQKFGKQRLCHCLLLFIKHQDRALQRQIVMLTRRIG